MIFIDRSIPKSVADALKLVGKDVLWLEDVFPHDTPDAVWLERAGAEGWLVVSRDKKVRTRPGERRAIVEGHVGCFCPVQKQPLSRWQYLKLLALTLDEMEQRFSGTPRPFLFAVGRTGPFKQLALLQAT